MSSGNEQRSTDDGPTEAGAGYPRTHVNESRSYINSIHLEPHNSQLSGGVGIGGVFSRFGLTSRGLSRKQEQIIAQLDSYTGKNTLANLLPTISKSEHVHEAPSVPCDDPSLYWVFKNIDFEKWKSSTDQHLLCVFAPSNKSRAMTDISLHVAHEMGPQTAEGAMFYFCPAVEEADTIGVTFVASLLRYVLYRSEDDQAKSIFMAFLKTLLRKTELDLPEGISLKEVLTKLPEFPYRELLQALERAILNIKCIQEALIIIDSIDNLGREGVIFLETFSERMARVARKFKLLITCSTNSGIEDLIKGALFSVIEYDKERQECLRTLSFDDTRYQKISEEHCGSLEWLWTHEKYAQWAASEKSSILHIQGKPGSGKSTLTKYFSEKLASRDPGMGSRDIARYFYTERGTQFEHTHMNMLRTILYNILKQDEAAFHHYQTRFRDFKDGGHQIWPYVSLKDTLLSFKNHPTEKPLCLILDAMDESEKSDREEIVELLYRLCSEESSCNIKVFLASRPIPELRHRNRGSHYTIIMQDENRKDIEKRVNAFLERYLGLESSIEGSLLVQVTEYICTHAEGVFIWVELVLKQLLRYLQRGENTNRILDFLKEIPYKELDDLYEQMIQKLEYHDGKDVEAAARFFRLVLFACRPLSVAELYNALDIPEGSNCLSFDPKSFEKDINTMEKRIMHCGGDFLETKGSKEKTVQTMHQTVREFFLHSARINPGSPFTMRGSGIRETAHSKMAAICFQHISFCFLNPSSPIQERLPNVKDSALRYFEVYAKYLDQWPFINYALENLVTHLYECGGNEKISQKVSKLKKKLMKNPRSRFVGQWIASCRQRAQRDLPSRFIGRWIVPRLQNLVQGTTRGAPEVDFERELFNAAAALDLPRVIHTLLLTCGSRKEAFLLLSAGKGYEKTVQVLLEEGADMEFQDDSGQRALHRAVENGHQSVTRLLLQQGANHRAKDKKGQSPLKLAILRW